MADVPAFAGIDAGGRRKGFDIAIVDARGRVRGHRGRCLSAGDVWAFVAPYAPAAIAIDSPCAPAPRGERARAGERALNRELCGIRWTPDREAIAAGGDYYDWIRRGLALYALLAARTRVPAIEVFPTASWTRWAGRRDGRRRTAWSRAALAALGLDGVPPRTSQDLRDALAAAVTAYQWWRGETDRFGEIVVPKADRLPRFERG